MVVAEGGPRMRAPWAASLAGILYAALFVAALLLLRTSPLNDATDAGLVRVFADSEDTPVVIGALYLAPISGIAFLWFIAVIRDQVLEREHQFFATVFIGSGLLYVALVFAAAAAIASIVVRVRYLDLGVPTANDIAVVRSLAYALLFGFASRAAAVFLISGATLGLHAGVFPRWFALTGYVAGLLLLVVAAFWDWIILVLPAWVAVVSVFILRRERARRGRRADEAGSRA
jgi:hypothetical protein